MIFCLRVHLPTSPFCFIDRGSIERRGSRAARKTCGKSVNRRFAGTIVPSTIGIPVAIPLRCTWCTYHTRSSTTIDNDVRYNDLRSEASHSQEECHLDTVTVSRRRLCFSQTCRVSRNAENVSIFFRTGGENNRSRHFNDPRDLARDWDNERSVGDRKWNVGKYVNDKTIQRTHYLAGIKLGSPHLAWLGSSRAMQLRESKPVGTGSWFFENNQLPYFA